MKKKIIWDTTKHSVDFPEEIKKIFFKNLIKNRISFCKLIEKLSKKRPNNVDWWHTILSSRNPYNSNLHKYITILDTLDVLLKKNFNFKIMVNSKIFYNLLKEKKYKKNFLVELSKESKLNKKNNLNIIKSIFFNLFIFLYIKIFVKKNYFKLQNFELTLIDTFLISSDLKKNYFYSPIQSKIGQKKTIFFVPTFIFKKNVFSIFSLIKKLNKKNYIFKEHFLSLNDFLFASLHFLRKKKLREKNVNYNRWDITELVNHEIQSNNDCFSSLVGILNYKFFYKIKSKKFKIRKTINWFENQIVDRGWNLGVNQTYPKADSIGYHGFANFSQYMNTIPCNFEIENQVLPKKIGVIGRAFKQSKREFSNKFKIVVAPALGQNHLFKTNNHKKIKNYVSLILSGIKHIDEKLLHWSLNFLDKEKKITSLEIKDHPIQPIHTLDIPNYLKYKDRIIKSKNLVNTLSKSSIVIAAGPTSAIFEALVSKCYLIIPLLDPCDKINLINCKIPNNNYSIAKSFDEFCIILNQILDNKRVIKLKKINKNFLFEKLNKKSIKFFY
jgi:hypothetical protein